MIETARLVAAEAALALAASSQGERVVVVTTCVGDNCVDGRVDARQARNRAHYISDLGVCCACLYAVCTKYIDLISRKELWARESDTKRFSRGWSKTKITPINQRYNLPRRQ